MTSNLDFEVGKWYSNRVKKYLVTGVEGNILFVDFEDGTRGTLHADVQSIIIKGMRQEHVKYTESMKRGTISDARQRDIEAILEQHKINVLYHFTDNSNLDSIRQYGGLFSWHFLRKAKIAIPRPGGNELSRKLDSRKCLENYVHLCFHRDQPMLHVLKSRGYITDPVILEIDKQVIYWRDTLFSDRNATANTANIGGTHEDFKRIRFDIIAATGWTNDNEKGYFQAEALVKKCVPIELIKNI